MSPTLSALAEPVFCDVKRTTYIRSPRGALVEVRFLSCGARTWRYVRHEARRPRTRIGCMNCYLKRQGAWA